MEILMLNYLLVNCAVLDILRYKNERGFKMLRSKHFIEHNSVEEIIMVIILWII